MSHKPNLSDFKMPIRDQILIKTIMEMTDKFKLIRCGLENCSWSEIICKPSEGPECPRYTLTGNEWAELMDLASTYIAAHPKLEWLSSSEHQYISEHGFRYTKEENEWEKLPWRWVVERTFAWMNTFRRLAKDFEITISSQETMVIISHVMLLIRRL